MTPRVINIHESLEDYYHQVMEYLDAKYDHHSVEPTYMPEDQIAEMNYYETQVRTLQSNDAPKGTVGNPMTMAEWREFQRGGR
jgi:hypothetical protein